MVLSSSLIQILTFTILTILTIIYLHINQSYSFFEPVSITSLPHHDVHQATIDDGFVTIRGRIKDVIITSGGKNIAPYPIEDRIKSELADFVSNCVVVGVRKIVTMIMRIMMITSLMRIIRRGTMMMMMVMMMVMIVY